MPRIAAATVREHRENVRTALVDAAESIVRTEGVDGLTAGAVTKAAGIARNSIYRYVDSVDDLRGLVLERHLPDWMGAVAEAVDAAGDDPSARILAWVETNLDQAARTGHGWLMDLATGLTLGQGSMDAVEHAHRDVEDVLLVEWRRLVSGDHPPFRGARAGNDTAAVDGRDDDVHAALRPDHAPGRQDTGGGDSAVGGDSTVGGDTTSSSPSRGAQGAHEGPGSGSGRPRRGAGERRAIIGAELTRSLVGGGFRLLDSGEDVTAVSPAVIEAVRSLLYSAAATRP